MKAPQWCEENLLWIIIKIRIMNKGRVNKNKVEKERWKKVENRQKRWLNSITLGYYLRKLTQRLVFI